MGVDEGESQHEITYFRVESDLDLYKRLRCAVERVNAQGKFDHESYAQKFQDAPSLEEMAAHDKFLAKLKDPIWLKI